MLITACPVHGPDPDEETDAGLLELNALSPEMAEIMDSLEPKIHEHLLNYVVSYNRVISLTNSVLLADLKKTSRQLLKDRSAAAVAEIDDLLDKCRDMEAFATIELKPVLDGFTAKYPKQIAALTAKKAKGDEWRARHLIEMMLDFEYQANFDLEKISRSTGVGMAKLKFLMDQTNQQLTTDVDIVDYQETEKEIARIETIRDTANTVNSALSLINPVQAIIKGGATATGATAIGWMSKAKTAVTVVENSSALLSFTSGVVNMAVAQEDIPPAFKAVSKANDYLGIVIGGKQGFTGANWGEKTVAIIGTSSSSTTMYFEVKDEGVKVSTKPLVDSTPADINPSTEASLGSILPAGDYRIPDVGLDDWAFPDFDWGGASKEQFWIDIYEGSAVAQASLDEMAGIFDNFAATWDSTVNNAKTKEAEAQSLAGLPDFFDDSDSTFPDPGDLGDAPAQEDFAVTLTASKLSGILPLTIDFTATPNQAFLSGEISFVWDFDDNTPVQTIEPGDSGYSNKIQYTFNDGTDYFDVKIRAQDGRGFWAEKILRITIAKTLQDIIDESGENSTIRISAGTYSEDIKLWKGCTLIGAGPESTILNGSIELYPDTRVEGFTVQGGNGIFATHDSVALAGLSEFYTEIEYNTIKTGTSYGVEIYPNEIFPFMGFIKNNTISDNSFHSIYVDRFAGIIQDNIISGKSATAKSFGITVHRSTAECLIDSNEISDHRASGISVGDNFKGTISNNEIFNNNNGLNLYGTASGSLIADNVIRDNLGSGGIFVEDGPGHGGTITRNEISRNSSNNGGGGLNLKKADAGSSTTANTISNNVDTSKYGGGGLYIATYNGGTVSSNVINGNSAKTNGGGVYIFGPSTPAANPKIKDSNTISGNNLSEPAFNAKADLYTPWAEDKIPAD